MPMTNDTTIEETLGLIKFNEQGLVPAIAQDQVDGTVLMMAWMNREAVRHTLESGDVTYFSRSRHALWRKGETSGHTQKLKSFKIDCDGDTLLLSVAQEGIACHTGRRTCFFRQVNETTIDILTDDEQGAF